MNTNYTAVFRHSKRGRIISALLFTLGIWTLMFLFFNLILFLSETKAPLMNQKFIVTFSTFMSFFFGYFFYSIDAVLPLHKIGIYPTEKETTAYLKYHRECLIKRMREIEQTEQTLKTENQQLQEELEKMPLLA